MENEIFEMYSRIVYSNKIIDAYNNCDETIEFPLHLEIKPNIKSIMDFNDKLFTKYENILLINSLVYALEHKEKNFLDFFNKYQDNLINTIKNETLFRIKITEFAIKNIILKIEVKNNNYFFDKTMNQNTIDNNIDIFNKVKENYTSYYSITNLYRKFLYDFINNNSDYIPDNFEFLDEFLFSTKYDPAFIFSTDGIINEENIKKYKIILTKMILGDSYIASEVYLYENEVDEYLNNLKDKYNINYESDLDEDDEKEYYIDICKDILDHLDLCLEENVFFLPIDADLRFDIYNKFFALNSDSFNKNLDIDTIENNKQMKLKLKRINPLYKFDQITFDNGNND